NHHERSEDAPIVRQSRPIFAPCSPYRSHQVASARRRTASLLHASLRFRYTQPLGYRKFTPTCLFSRTFFSIIAAHCHRQVRPWLRLIRECAVENAFGGQVIGSTARLRRRTSGSGSPLKSIK